MNAAQSIDFSACLKNLLIAIKVWKMRKNGLKARHEIKYLTGDNPVKTYIAIVASAQMNFGNLKHRVR
jgi:predicted small integral membrane protein